MIEILATRRIFVAILALGLFTMAARGMADPDAWWHLLTGQLMLQNHAFFHTDPYSFTRFGQPWINHEWLSQIIMFAVYRVAGFGGLIVAFAVVIAASLFLVYLRSRGRPYVAGVITLWGALASASTWGVRPQMFSLLLASIFLVLLEASEVRYRLLWWTVPLMLLWVNLHAGYPIGLALIALFLAGEALEAALREEPWQRTRPRLKLLGMVFVACLAVVPLNPNGFRIYSYPFQTLRSAAMSRFIHEWFSPDFHDLTYLPLLLILLALIAGLAISPHRPRLRNLVLLLVAIPAALRSVRHIPILILVLVPILAELVQACLERWNAAQWFERPVERPTGRILFVNLILLSGFLIFAVMRVDYVVKRQGETEARHFPMGAAAFLAAHRIAGPMLNHYNWGGYFIWKLYPEYLVFMDGRADVYGDVMMNDFDSIYHLTGDWKSHLGRYGIRTVVLPPDAPLVVALRASLSWKQIYADTDAVVLTRTP
jgi:hypothetical protein